MNGKTKAFLLFESMILIGLVWFFYKPTTIMGAQGESGFNKLAFNWSENENLEILLSDPNQNATIFGTSDDYFLATKGSRKIEGTADVVANYWKQEAVDVETGKWLMKKGHAFINLAGPVVSVTLSPDGLRLWFPIGAAIIVCIILYIIALPSLKDKVPNSNIITMPTSGTGYHGQSSTRPVERSQAVKGGLYPSRIDPNIMPIGPVVPPIAQDRTTKTLPTN